MSKKTYWDESDVELTNEIWRQSTGWCPLCWWKRTEQYHVSTNAAGIRRDMLADHRKRSPNCHERIRIEGK